MSGHSLIEVLVALLVIATGVLGAVALQVASLNGNRAALDRTVSAQAAWSIADRMRTNPGADYAAAIGDPPPPFRDCIAAPCAPADLAAFDLAVWKCGLGRWSRDAVCAELMASGVIASPSVGLPSGDGAIDTEGGRMTVTVSWQRGARVAMTAVTRA